MRQVIVMSIDQKVLLQYGIKEFHRALEDITASGATAVDLKFDCDGDVIIFIIPKIVEKT